MKPTDIDEAVRDYCGFYPPDASGMTDAEIEAYFSPANFKGMWPEDDDISDWPWTHQELANHAIEMKEVTR